MTNEGRVGMDELRRRACGLVPELRAAALETERNRRVSEAAMDALRRAELFKLLQPAWFGGFEHGFADAIEIAAELGRGCASTAWCASLTIATQWLLGCFPLAAQDDVWGAHPDHVAVTIFAPTGQAERADDGYRISGRWPFLSNIDNNDWSVLACLYTPDAADAPIPGFFLVPRADYGIDDTWFTAGLAGTGSKTAVIETPAFVPHHRVVSFAAMASGDSPGARESSSALYRVPFMAFLPMSLVAPALGVVEGAIDEFVAQTSVRRVHAGAERGSRMAEHAAVQSRLAEAAVAIDAARLLLERDARELDAVVRGGGPISLDLRIRNRRDQGYATRLANQAANLLFELGGATGLALDNPVQRAWRDVNAIARHIGLNWDVVSTMYGQHRFGVEPRGQY